MKFVVCAFLFAFCLGLASAANQDVYFIDNFDVYSDTLIVVTSGSTVFPAVDQSFTQDSGLFSGERDHLLSVESAPSGMVFSSSVDAGEYASNAPPSGSAFSLLQYDGIDGTIELDPSGGLGDPDNNFTNGAAFALHLVITSDQPSTVEAFVYSGSSSDFCSFTFNVPGNSQTADYVANYSQFDKVGAGCDFTNVGAVELTSDLPPNVDLIVELFATYGTVSNPTKTRTPSPSPIRASASRSRAPSNKPCNCNCPGFHCVIEFDPSGVNTFYYDISDINTSHNTISSGSTQSNTNNNNSSNNSSSDANTLSVALALVFAVVALLI